MKKLLFLLLTLTTISVNSQTLDDFPWLSEIVDPANCCDAQTVTVFDEFGQNFVWVQPNADCSLENGKLYAQNGDCWCENWGDFSCLDFYGFSGGTNIYTCSQGTLEPNLFSNFPWLSSVVDEENCCAEQSVLAYNISGYSFLYVNPDPACSSEPARLYFEDGQLWCTDYPNYSCLDLYGFSGQEDIAWTCDAVDCVETNWYQDADGDGLGNPAVVISACTQPSGYVTNDSDTNDSCNGVVDACGVCNGSGESMWCQDLDGDGLGNSAVSLSSCTQPSGYVSDCSDTNDSCNGVVDACGVCNGSGESMWCQDLDGDGLGNSAVSLSSCDQPSGYVSDCSDTNDSCNGTVDACGVCNGSGESMWCQDLDGDGLGNSDISLTACDQPSGYVSDCTDTDDSGTTDCLIDGIHAAFAEFSTGSFTILLSGNNIVMETDGLPNHTSPYWSNTTERCLNGPMGEMCTNTNTTENHPLFVEPTNTTFDQMAPGNIDDFNGSYSLTVPVSPALASSSSSTGLGAIGFAVSGSMIYNDEEGPNVPLDNAVGSLDYTAAHTGPQSYHYHLETKAWSEDDDALIGIIADGFFIYGRKCNSTGTYPTDLDESGGHTSTTQHSCGEEYHYHIQNDLYLNEYYILFPGDYQGTPNNIQ